MEEKHDNIEHHPTREKRQVKFKLIYAVIAVIVAVGALTTVFFILPSLGGTSSAVVVSGDNISVYYTGSFTNGSVFGSNMGGTPFSFVVGAGQMVPGFDSAVVGMHVGQTKNVTLPPAEAYGYFNSSLVITINASAFRNQSIYNGEIVSNGVTTGVIMEINGTNTTGKISPEVVVNGTNDMVWGNDTTVSINFNPPLAGDTLNFEIKIASINT